MDQASVENDSASGSGEPDLIRVYRETVEPLYRYVIRRTGGHKELAEDIVQEVYLRATDAWRRGNRPDEPLAWLQTVARNLLIKYFRRRKPQSVDPALLNGVIDQAQPPPTPEAVAMIQWGMAQLADRHARLLEAFHLDGQSTKAIAEARGLSERAVEGRLHRARAALRKRLAPLISGGLARQGETP